MLEGFSQPAVVCGIGVLSHEGIGNRFVTLENLSVNFALIVVPDSASRLGVHRLDRQDVAHLLRLEDPALWIHEREAHAAELKPRLQFSRCQMIVDFTQAPNMLEGL